MPLPFLVPAAIAGLGALGGIFKNRGSTQSQTGNSQNYSNFLNQNRNTSTTMPVQSGLGEAYLNNITNRMTGMLEEDPDLTEYTAYGMQNINNLSDLKNQALESILASKGITGPAAATAQIGAENQRFSDISNFKNQIPLLARELRQNALGQAAGFYSQIPRGNEQVDTMDSWGNQNNWGNQEGTQTQPGNMLGGLFGDLAPILAFLYGKGAFKSSGGNTGVDNIG